jgi:thioredoxin reductase (NADPH)
MFKLDLEETKQKTAQKDILYDVLIIGAGSAGLTAGIYTARDGWKTLILERKESGGLAATTHMIENYPGFPDGVEGSELMARFEKQARRFGVDVEEFEEVQGISERPEGGFLVETSQGDTYQGQTVLLATGSAPKKLGIPGEDEFYNRGVSYCATCDGPLYKDEEVAVIGCGNSGLQEAQILLQYAEQVTFVEYLPYSIAEQVLQDRVKSHQKSMCMLSHSALEIQGEDRVETLVVKNNDTDRIHEINVSAVFIYIGYEPYTEFLDDLVELDDQGYVITDRRMHTSRDGIFAAGDVRSDNLAQVAVAVGDGAQAAVSIREYLQG